MKIGVRHQGEDKIERVTVVRDIIHVATVLGDHYKPDGSWDYMLDKEEQDRIHPVDAFQPAQRDRT